MLASIACRCSLPLRGLHAEGDGRRNPVIHTARTHDVRYPGPSVNLRIDNPAPVGTLIAAIAHCVVIRTGRSCLYPHSHPVADLRLNGSQQSLNGTEGSTQVRHERRLEGRSLLISHLATRRCITSERYASAYVLGVHPTASVLRKRTVTSSRETRVAAVSRRIGELQPL